MLVVDEGTTTAIQSLEDIMNADIYDLSGRKAERIIKGNVYVIGNKKVIVK